MATSSSSVIPTPLAHSDNQGEGHPWGSPLHISRGRLATLGHDFTPSYPKTESLPLAIPHSKGEETTHSLAGVNGPSHSYTSPLKSSSVIQDDEAEKKL
ncbi:hypothetical protein TNCV_2061731 [Trichonephila clavipes]|nr:hypothetical protein TNCV_2061731 [Trichonephila clavipes]